MKRLLIFSFSLWSGCTHVAEPAAPPAPAAPRTAAVEAPVTPPPKGAAEVALSQSTRALFEEHCSSCHDGSEGTPRLEHTLETLPPALLFGAVVRLSSKTMPPPPLSLDDGERKSFVETLCSELGEGAGNCLELARGGAVVPVLPAVAFNRGITSPAIKPGDGSGAAFFEGATMGAPGDPVGMGVTYVLHATIAALDACSGVPGDAREACLQRIMRRGDMLHPGAVAPLSP